jgi:hypothetical protein
MRVKSEQTKKVPLYVPLSLLAKLEDSQKHSRRSFNQEVIWRLEQSYMPDISKVHRRKVKENNVHPFEEKRA